jgi:hypothetical protein
LYQKEGNSGIIYNTRSDIDEDGNRNLVKNLERKIESLTEEEERRLLKGQL